MHYLYDDNSPIIACSSGNSSNTGISVIRLSGVKEFSIFSSILNIDFSNLRYRHSYYTDLVFDNKIIDSVIAVFFKAPNTFNGENILELSVHGNVLNVDRIIDLFVKKLSFRLSYPGEFTYRAYKNKKLNLSQVEGLDLLLNANSQFAIDQGLSLLDGDLNNLYNDLHSSFIKHKSSIELSMDFYEDVGEDAAQLQLNNSFAEFNSIINKLYSKFSNSENLLNPKVTLLGEPNAGKSTIFNRILNSNRSIVSDIKGTTRDFITEKIKIHDAFFELVDTAGIRDDARDVEAIGISRTLEIASKSFYNILLIDASKPSLDIAQFHGSIDSIIFTHTDLIDTDELNDSVSKVLNDTKLHSLFLGPIEPVFCGSMGAEMKVGPIGPKSGSMGASIRNGSIGPQTGSMGANKENGPIEPKKVLIQFSDDTTLMSLQDSLDSIYNKFNNLSLNNEVLLERHKHLLFSIYKMCLEYQDLLSNSNDISIISSEFNNIGYLISELIGIVTAEDILQNIFTNFCIGK